jgi:hypothetical protein
MWGPKERGAGRTGLTLATQDSKRGLVCESQALVSILGLLDNLRKRRIPLWFVRMICSFLAEQTTILLVDGEE